MVATLMETTAHAVSRAQIPTRTRIQTFLTNIKCKASSALHTAAINH